MRKTVLLAIIAFLSFNVSAQIVNVDYSNPKKYTIGDITISGVKYLNINALKQISGLQKGQIVEIPGTEITNAIENLWKQGLFSDVKISVTKTVGDTAYLDIYLRERPRLSKIYFYGIKRTEKQDLEDKIKLIPGSQVTEHVLTRTKNIIRNYYIEKGFYFTEVDILQREDTTLQNVVNLYVYVTKHEKVKIKEIQITGNTVFSTRKIQMRYMKETKRKRWWGLFKPSKYVPEKFEEDKKAIIKKYNEKGYRDAEIVMDSVAMNPDSTLTLFMKIKEGKQYFFRNISWVGNTKYPTELLQSKLDIKKGDVFDQDRLDKRLLVDDDAVGNLYLDNGYLFFQAIPKELSVENDSVDLEIQIFEGPQATINRVTLTGNDRTNDYVALREIHTLPGQLFSKSDLVRSVRELAQLGNFDPEHLTPTPRPNQADGTVDIDYSVVEKSNDIFELSGGWGANMFVGRMSVRFNNFSSKNILDKSSWQPLPTGDGEQLALSVQANGSRYQLYSISFMKPWVGGKKANSLSVSLYHNIMSNGYKQNDERRQSMSVTGVSLGLGRRLKWPDDYFHIYNEIAYQKYLLNDWNWYNMMTDGESNKLSFKTVISRNSVDNPIYSRRGSNFSLSVELTPPFSLLRGANYSSNEEKYKWVEFHKWLFTAQWFNPVVGDLVIHTKFDYGIIGYYSKNFGYPPLEGYVLGGDGMGLYYFGKDVIGLRGYENESLTAKNGAYLYTKYTFEIRHPIVMSEQVNIFGMLFLEAGNSWHEINEFNPFKIYRSAGVGVRFFLPMLGMLGIDWGYGFDPVPGRPGANGSNFAFTMGQRF